MSLSSGRSFTCEVNCASRLLLIASLRPVPSADAPGPAVSAIQLEATSKKKERSLKTAFPTADNQNLQCMSYTHKVTLHMPPPPVVEARATLHHSHEDILHWRSATAGVNGWWGAGWWKKHPRRTLSAPPTPSDSCGVQGSSRGSSRRRPRGCPQKSGKSKEKKVRPVISPFLALLSSRDGWPPSQAHGLSRLSLCKT